MGLKQWIWEDSSGTLVSVENTILVSTVELSPQRVPEVPCGVKSSLFVCLSVHMSVRLSVCLSCRPRRFLAIICAAC